MRLVDAATGKVEKITYLDDHYFGEGITILDHQIFQLTWQNRIAVVYDEETFAVEKTFQYQGEGWGLATDGKHLMMSDGSSTIRFLDPKTFEVVKRITVKSSRGRVDKLNELEGMLDMKSGQMSGTKTKSRGFHQKPVRFWAGSISPISIHEACVEQVKTS